MYKPTKIDLKSMNARIIDLRSDAVSHPTQRMRSAMASAVVGDDVFREDPTVQELEDKCAKLFLKEAALFVISGIMGNLVSIMTHCRERSAEAIVGASSHVFLFEQGGAASIAGVLLNTIPNNPDGTFSLEEFQSKIRGSDPLHEPRTSMVVVENTHNLTGGKVIPLEWMDDLAAICKKRNIKMHMDGARVFHAAEYLNVPVSRIARDFDSITFCLSKSLCCPVGSVLVGSRDFIEYARNVRRVLGGGVPQMGILAAPGLVALEDIVPKLGDDHRRTREIAQAIHEMQSPFVTVDIDDIQTNICMMHFLQPEKYTAKDFLERLQQINEKELSAGAVDASGKGIIVNVSAKDEKKCIRFVIYHHINDESTQLTINKFKYCIEELNHINFPLSRG